MEWRLGRLSWRRADVGIVADEEEERIGKVAQGQ